MRWVKHCFVAVKEFWKPVKAWWNYRRNRVAGFLGIVYFVNCHCYCYGNEKKSDGSGSHFRRGAMNRNGHVSRDDWYVNKAAAPVHSVRLWRPHAAFTCHFSEESPSRLHSSSNMNDTWPQIIHAEPDRQRDRRQRLSIGSRFARAPNLDVTWLSSTVRCPSRVWNKAFSHIFSV